MIESAFTVLARDAYWKVQLDEAKRACNSKPSEANKRKFDVALKQYRKAHRQLVKMDREENWNENETTERMSQSSLPFD